MKNIFLSSLFVLKIHGVNANIYCNGSSILYGLGIFLPLSYLPHMLT